jgi:hypothetical protein
MPTDPYAEIIRAGDAALASAAEKLPTMTYAMPGSDEKVSVLGQRVRHHQLLWHPLDPVIRHDLQTAFERLGLESLTVANGRSVKPQVFEEIIVQSTREEIDLAINTNDVRPMARACHIEPPENSCPVCHWWHRTGPFCSWCGLDLERAAGIERRHREAEAAEDAFCPSEME